MIHRLKARYRPKARAQVQCLASSIPSGAVIVDVGAHFGYFGKEFCRIHGGSCRVYCFEPLGYSYGILCEVLARFPNGRPIRLALDARSGEIDLHVPIKSSGKIGLGLAHLGPDAHRDCLIERVRAITVDEWIGESGLERLDFVKCDIEGAELPMLRGAEQSLRRHHPVLFCEVDAAYTRRLDYAPRDLFEYLAGFGYRSYRMHVPTCALREVDGYEGRGDYVFKSSSRG